MQVASKSADIKDSSEDEQDAMPWHTQPAWPSTQPVLDLAYFKAAAPARTTLVAQDRAARIQWLNVGDQDSIPAMVYSKDSSSNRGSDSSGMPTSGLHVSQTGSTAAGQHTAAHINQQHLHGMQNDYISTYLDRKGLKSKTPGVLRMLDEYRGHGHDLSPDEAILRIFVDLWIPIDVTDAPVMPASLPTHMQHQTAKSVSTATETSSNSDWSSSESEDSDDDALPDLLSLDASGAVALPSPAALTTRQRDGSREDLVGSLPGAANLGGRNAAALRELDTSTESEHSSYDDDYDDDDVEEELPDLAPSFPWDPEHNLPARRSSTFSFTPFASLKTTGPMPNQPEPAADLSRAAASTATPWLVDSRGLHTSSKCKGSHEDDDDGAVSRIMYDDNGAVMGVMNNGSGLSLDVLGQFARPPASATFRIERPYGFTSLPAPRPKQLDPLQHAHQGRLHEQPASAELRAFSKLLAEHGVPDMQASERMEVQFSDGRAVMVAGMYQGPHQTPHQSPHQTPHQAPHQAPEAIPAEALRCISDVLEPHTGLQWIPDKRPVRAAGMSHHPRQRHHVQLIQHAERAKHAQHAQQASEATCAEMANLAYLLPQHGIPGMQATDDMALHFLDGRTRKVSGMYQPPGSADPGHMGDDALKPGADERCMSEWFDNFQLGGGSIRLGGGSTRLGSGRTQLGGGSTRLGSRSITSGSGSIKSGSGSTNVSRGREWEVVEAMKVLGLDRIPGIRPDLFIKGGLSGLDLAAAALGHPSTSRGTALLAAQSSGPSHKTPPPGQQPVPRSPELSGPAFKWYVLADTVDGAGAVVAGAVDTAGAGAGTASTAGMSGAADQAGMAATTGTADPSQLDDDGADDDDDDDDDLPEMYTSSESDDSTDDGFILVD